MISFVSLISIILFIFIEGFIESQIDHLKRIQTKLTLFSLQSDKCVSKVSKIILFFVNASSLTFSFYLQCQDEVLIDECVQVLSILNNLSYDCSSAKVSAIFSFVKWYSRVHTF